CSTQSSLLSSNQSFPYETLPLHPSSCSRSYSSFFSYSCRRKPENGGRFSRRGGESERRPRASGLGTHSRSGRRRDEERDRHREQSARPNRRPGPEQSHFQEHGGRPR